MSNIRKIGEGRYRTVYEDSNNRCYKMLKPFLVKKYLGAKVKYPLRLYTYLKFGIWDFNVHEFQMYQNLKETMPAQVMDHIVPLTDIGLRGNASMLVETLIRDIGGKISPPLSAFEGRLDENFWTALQTTCLSLEQNGFPHLGINDTNVVVQTTSGGIKPVIVDLKRIGLETFPFQPWLVSHTQRVNKIKRKLKRLSLMYRNPTN